MYEKQRFIQAVTRMAMIHVAGAFTTWRVIARNMKRQEKRVRKGLVRMLEMKLAAAFYSW